MTTEPLDRPLDRRFLIRGGAVLAGAAGATALGAALAPVRADAADGANVVLGAENNASETRTVITIDGATGGPDPALVLRNANGPSLALQALEDLDRPLAVGQIANTIDGPYIGIEVDGKAATTFLATGADLLTPYPVGPTRVLDRELRAGATATVTLPDTDGVALAGVFLNVTVLAPGATGYLEVFTPGKRPGFATVRYTKAEAAANSAFIEPGVNSNGTRYTLRVYTSQRARVLIEVTGVVSASPPALNSAARATGQRRLTRQAKQRERLVTSLRNG